ncbi:protein FAM151B [Cylas formicarius]|uniref:protein FAM151B n=1 Tax=Cylas formicarius TaxID=197179 RepID=UPI0029584395|nr:protein FAM151B [Cylas formicarius]
MLRGLLVLLLIFAVSLMTSQADTGGFFPDIEGNLTKITWAHAVNNQSYLDEVLNNDGIMMIEADISLGKVNGDDKVVPIMAHPPDNTSDISLESFLQQIDAFNQDETNRKGVKLDFKTIEVFNSSLDIVGKYEKASYPIWINADILPGPIDASTLPVDADQFLENIARFPNATLSIGWTTMYGATMTGSYDTEQIDAMLDVIERHKISQAITFPVRAGLAAESRDLMKKLLGAVDGSTLTIWSSHGDNVDVEDLRKLVAMAGINKTYIDVPAELLSQLHLDDLPKGGAIKVTAGALLLAVVCVTATLF